MVGAVSQVRFPLPRTFQKACSLPLREHISFSLLCQHSFLLWGAWKPQFISSHPLAERARLRASCPILTAGTLWTCSAFWSSRLRRTHVHTSLRQIISSALRPQAKQAEAPWAVIHCGPQGEASHTWGPSALQGGTGAASAQGYSQATQIQTQRTAHLYLRATKGTVTPVLQSVPMTPTRISQPAGATVRTGLIKTSGFALTPADLTFLK